MRQLLFLTLAGLLWLASPTQAASCSNTAVGAFTCVQSYANNVTTATTTPAWTLPNTIGASTDILVGALIWTSTTATMTLAASGTGCTGATVTTYDNKTSSLAWSAAGFSVIGLTAGGSCTLTATLSTSQTAGLVVHELSGALSSGDPVSTRHLWAVQNSPGTGTDAVTVGPVTATGTDYIFGASLECSQTSTINAGTGYTVRENTNNSGAGCRLTSEDKSASGANTVTFTDTNASQVNFTTILSVAASGGGATRGCKNGIILMGAGCDVR